MPHEQITIQNIKRFAVGIVLFSFLLITPVGGAFAQDVPTPDSSGGDAAVTGQVLQTQTASPTTPSTPSGDQAVTGQVLQTVQKQAEAQAADNASGGCSGIFSCLKSALFYVFAALLYLPVMFTSLLVFLAGGLLDFTIGEVVIDLGSWFRDITAISTTWMVFRDLANILFIFGLLAIAISTILGLGGYGYKKLLAQLIIVALVINFSLFFTKFVIDASNLFALQFYNGIVANSDDSLAGEFMNVLGVETAFDAVPIIERIASVGLASTGGIGMMFSYAILTSIFFVVTAFVFFFAAIMLIIRAASFVLLAILSPLAFAALVLPFTSQYAWKWWGKLWNYAIFAPVLMMLFWVTLQVIPGITSSLPNIQGIAEVFANNPSTKSGSIALIFNFAILITLMIASIIIANNLALSGAKGMSNFGKGMAVGASKWTGRKAGGATLGFAGRVARETVGRQADRLAQSEFMKRFELRNPRLGGIAARTAERVSKAQMDPRSLLGKKAADFVGTPGTGGYIEDRRRIAELRTAGADRVAKLAGDDVDKQIEHRKDYARNVRRAGGVVSPTVYDANQKAAGSIEAVASGVEAEKKLKETNQKIAEVNRDLGKARATLNAASSPITKEAARKRIGELEDQKAKLETEKEEFREKKEKADKPKETFK